MLDDTLAVLGCGCTSTATQPTPTRVYECNLHATYCVAIGTAFAPAEAQPLDDETGQPASVAGVILCATCPDRRRA